MEMFVKTLPRTKYLVYTSKVHDRNSVEYLFKDWISEKGYEQSYPFIIQAYDYNRYKGLDDKESEIDWYIPIKKV